MESGGHGNQPKAQCGKVVSIREVYVPVRYPEQESRDCKSPSLGRSPSHRLREQRFLCFLWGNGKIKAGSQA